MNQKPNFEDYGRSPAENYERYFVPAIGAPAANGLMKVAALHPGERVLDVACGTGVVSRLASAAVGTDGRVVGLDLNPGMLAVARSAAPPDANIEWREASAEAMPFPEDSFDAVLCQMGLQFMSDRHAALSEMRRVLEPDGRLILNLTGPTPQLFAIMGEALGRHVGAEAEGFVRQVFSLNDTEEIEDLINGAGFRDVSTMADTRSLRLPAPEKFLWQYIFSTPLAVGAAKLDEERRESLERDVVGKWQEFVEDGALMFEVRIVVATARKQTDQDDQ